MSSTPPPIVAPPGAGLPAMELRVAQWLFGVRRALGSRRSFAAKFDRERGRVAALVVGCEAEAGARRVLIRRLPGLEDSSRDWSVWMTLEHLRIVHRAMAEVIAALGRGIEPPGRPSTAAVKPSPEVGREVVPAYEESCEMLLAAVAAVPELRTRARYAHPWFGPLDAAGWWALAGGHMGIHRGQIERILAGLPGRGA